MKRMRSRVAMRNRSHTSSKRLGASAVEFAFVAPLFFLFLIGIFDFSRANMIRNTAENAVYEGARTGIVPGATSAQVESSVNRVLSALAIRNSTVTITPNPILEASPRVTVQVTIPLSSNLYASFVFLRGVTITRSCTLTRENFAGNAAP